MKQGHCFSRLLYVLGLLISILSSGQCKALDFEKVVNATGFRYDAIQDIYVTKINSAQRIFGYHRAFDFLMLGVGMVVDAEPIRFHYDGKLYMIELWKGQYHLMAGAEIGIYEQNGRGWKSIEDEDMPYMSYTLAKNGIGLFDRQETHWWLTGFIPGIFATPEELTLENVFIDFKEAGMRDAFLDGLHEAGYDDVDDKIIVDGTNSISFRFSTPKTRQVWAQPMRNFYLRLNMKLVKMFNNKKAALGRTDSSPASLNLILSL